MKIGRHTRTSLLLVVLLLLPAVPAFAQNRADQLLKERQGSPSLRPGKLKSKMRQRPATVAGDRILVKLKNRLPEVVPMSEANAADILATSALEAKFRRHGVTAVEQLVKNPASIGAPSTLSAQQRSQPDPWGLDRVYMLRLSRGADLKAALEDFASDPEVEYADFDHVVRAYQLPNDPRYPSQWALDNIRAPQAWDFSTGNSDVLVAVIDSGIDYNHPDLAGRLVPGYDFVNDDSDAMDDNGHGTRLAGIIGAAGNNGIGIAGINWSVGLMPVKVLQSNGDGFSSWLFRGIRYAVDNGAKIINLSLGGFANPAVQDSINYAHSKGCLVVAAMGNQNSGTAQYPAAYPNVMAVGATDSRDNRASNSVWGSNFGAHIDVVAPGVNILSTSLGNSYQSMDGTSLATPMVAGIAALILSIDPGLTADQIQDLIQRTADDLVGSPREDTSGWDQFYGWGRVNALRAVETLSPPNNPPSFTSNPVTAATEGVAYSYSIIVADPDPGETLTITGTYPGWLNLTSSGQGTATLSGNPGNAQVGSHPVGLTVTDSGGLTANQSFTITVANVNEPPGFNSDPVTSVRQGSAYRYAITTFDPDAGDSRTLTGTYPAWLTLNTTGNGTGTLSGTPGNAEVGNHAINLEVTDAGGLSATQSFTFSVANVNDPPAFTSTPVTAAQQGSAYSYAVTASDIDAGDNLVISGTYPTWLTLTDNGDGTAALGGTPDAVAVGDHPVTLTATDAGGLSASQSFTLTVSAIAVQPASLACPTAGAGPACVIREDGGDASSNLDPATGKPRIDAQFRFQVVLTDPSGAPPQQIVLVLNGYAYPMQPAGGDPVTGATYAFTTWLGPAAVCAYHFEARDSAGNVIFRHPASGEIAGPAVRLVAGINLVGVPRELNRTTLNATQALGTANAYRWISKGLTSLGNSGYFALVDQTGPVRAGEGYFLRQADVGDALPKVDSVPEIAAEDFTLDLLPGWNMISNPYGGLVRLADIEVQRGAAAPVPWPQATTERWLPNVAYYFQGSDWGNRYGYISSNLDPDASLVPWIGYWLYLSRSDASYRLILPKPAQ